MKKYESLHAALLDLAGSDEFSAQPVYGGDINRAYKLTLNGRSIFMKANRNENARFFDPEISGLYAIRRTGTIRVPETICSGQDGQYGSFLLLEWCQGNPGKEFFENFGHNLAAMHLADTSGTVRVYGFPEDNFIGAGKQENTPENSSMSLR